MTSPSKIDNLQSLAQMEDVFRPNAEIKRTAKQADFVKYSQD